MLPFVSCANIRTAKGTGTGSWAAAYAKASALVAQMTLDEKASYPLPLSILN